MDTGVQPGPHPRPVDEALKASLRSVWPPWQAASQRLPCWSTGARMRPVTVLEALIRTCLVCRGDLLVDAGGSFRCCGCGAPWGGRNDE